MLLLLRRFFALAFTNRWVGCVWAVLVGLAGVRYYANVLDHVYPIKTWLFWQLGAIWGWVLLFNLACLSVGQLVLARVLRLPDLRTLEAAVFGMAIGVVAFTWAMYIGGALACFGPVFAVLLPLGMLAVSAREGLAFTRRVLADYRAPTIRSPFTILATVFGVICVGVIYLQVMTPDSLNYDSTWCHLTVAQDYAREHRIVAFPADYNKNVPQLHSLIHTWGFTVPGLTPPLRWMLALHNEFALFLWTLAGTAAGISALIGVETLRGSWAAFFLFPIIFVYDHNLGGAGDHICAFFTIPFLLALLRLCNAFRIADAALLAIVSAGALLTKYQAAYIVAPAVAVILLRAAWCLVVPRCSWLESRPLHVPFKRIARALGVLVAVGVVLVSPHFLRNLLFYGNPVYPYLSAVFPGSKPQVPNGAYYVEYILKDFAWRPHGTLLVKLKHAITLCFSFSFEPHYSFTHNVPAFGSLFTLLLPLAPFVRSRYRIAVAAALAGGALFIWAFTYNVDRNLQIFMPIMVCITGALIVEAFRLGWLARVGLLPLVALQLVWGGDALFYSGGDRIRSSIDLIRSGFEGHAQTRLDSYRSTYLAIARALPKNAKVVLHTSHINLGVDHELLLDWVGFQGLISYDSMRTPRDLFERFKALGITHLLVPRERPASSKQEQVVWDTFVSTYAQSIGSFGGYQLFSMPLSAPRNEPPYRVASFGIHGYSDGIYPIERMKTIEYLPSELQTFAQPEIPLSGRDAGRSSAFASVDAVFTGPGSRLDAHALELLHENFRNIQNFGSTFTLYVRRQHLGN